MSTSASYPLPPTAVIFPLLSISAIILEIPPFVWHVKNRNFGAACLIVYFFLLQFMGFINPIIWPRDNVQDWYDGKGLCDVEIRIQLMAYIGLPGCITCIIRRLAAILDTNRAVLSEASKANRRLMGDIFLCVGFPVIINALYYIVQPNRYYIFTVSGCKWPVSYSWPSVIIVQMWPILFSLVNAYLAGKQISSSTIYFQKIRSTNIVNTAIVIYRLYRYRAGFSTLMTNSSTTKSRFLRLFIISASLIFFVLPISIQALVVTLNSSYGYFGYSWYFTHYINWGIQKVPTGGRISRNDIDSIIAIVSGYLIFFCFGMGKDATNMYREWATKLGLLRIFPCLKERTLSSSRVGNSIGSSTVSANRHITVTTTRESKSEP
jgi:pheromone a factor receptor